MEPDHLQDAEKAERQSARSRRDSGLNGGAGGGRKGAPALGWGRELQLNARRTAARGGGRQAAARARETRPLPRSSQGTANARRGAGKAGEAEAGEKSAPAVQGSCFSRVQGERERQRKKEAGCLRLLLGLSRLFTWDGGAAAAALLQLTGSLPHFVFSAPSSFSSKSPPSSFPVTLRRRGGGGGRERGDEEGKRQGKARQGDAWKAPARALGGWMGARGRGGGGACVGRPGSGKKAGSGRRARRSARTNSSAWQFTASTRAPQCWAERGRDFFSLTKREKAMVCGWVGGAGEGRRDRGGVTKAELRLSCSSLFLFPSQFRPLSQTAKRESGFSGEKPGTVSARGSKWAPAWEAGEIEGGRPPASRSRSWLGWGRLHFFPP